MGQEACKAANPEAPNCPTTRGRRHGRRRISLSFTPTLNGQSRREHQHTEDHEQHELEDETVNSSHEPLPNNTETGELVCQSVSSQTSGLESNQISGNPHEDSKDLVECASGGHQDVNGSNGVDVVNTDSSKSDDKSREKGDAQIDKSLATEESDKCEETLDNTVSEHDEEVESFMSFEPQLSALSPSVSRECCQEGGPMSLMRHLNTGSDMACASNSTFKSSTEGHATPKSNPSDANCETQHTQNKVDDGIRSPVPTANELKVNDGETDQGNSHELVVKPKIRSQNTANQVRTQQLLRSDGGEGSGSWRTMEVLQGYAQHDMRKSRGEMSSSILFHSKEYKGPQKSKELDLGKNAAAQEQKYRRGSSTFQDDSEDHGRDISMSRKHDRSECNDEECFEAVPNYPVVTGRHQFSNGKSWPVVSVMPEEQSSSSSDKENEAPDFCVQKGSGEEEEVPCLMAPEEPESSSVKEALPVDTLVRSSSCVLLVLDGDSNFDDESSMGEDVDIEWSLIDEATDSLGPTNPQYLAFVAVGGNLQRDMESLQHAMAHLESSEPLPILQSHPPADKDTIDGLPFIVITDDHNGQQHCCTICCSEYVKGEIVTELPCHHTFHLSCVTDWLQQSGTCPVCRHVLSPVLPEMADATPFDDDSASSDHSAPRTSD